MATLRIFGIILTQLYHRIYFVINKNCIVLKCRFVIVFRTKCLFVCCFRKNKMAFEDRCSPQSAPSPPGIPHSPQKTAIVLVTNSSDSQNIYNNVYVRYSTANSEQQLLDDLYCLLLIKCAFLFLG